ncbi:hypothetical protein ACO2Q3_08800 [Caulobacter sp. KR2-114]|uniref:hypothetical protein n=1 Tax=Caulobacter sp. KR2-114 TaxID=3400912 RepID=UPI003C019F12
MIRFSTAAATAALTLLAAPAFAQSATPGDQAGPSQAAPADQGSMTSDPSMAPAAPAATSAGVNTGAIVYQSSPTPADQAYALKAGDPTVVSNAPVPDTRANRARYGRPLSMTGRKTAPAGN